MNAPLTRDHIIEAAIECFVRLGVRKSAMADIADRAGVSRQTLYDLFGSKNELIRASIEAITAQALAAIEDRWAGCHDLSQKLDVYFDETVWKSFEILQLARDADDLISGHNAAGAEAIARSHTLQVQRITDALHPFSAELGTRGLTPESYAEFVVSVSMGFKYVRQRDTLTRLLAALRASILATVGE